MTKVRDLKTPEDAEILAYNNVPVSVAAAYLCCGERKLRDALKQGAPPFGVRIQKRGGQQQVENSHKPRGFWQSVQSINPRKRCNAHGAEQGPTNDLFPLSISRDGQKYKEEIAYEDTQSEAYLYRAPSGDKPC